MHKNSSKSVQISNHGEEIRALLIKVFTILQGKCTFLRVFNLAFSQNTVFGRKSDTFMEIYAKLCKTVSEMSLSIGDEVMPLECY